MAIGLVVLFGGLMVLGTWLVVKSISSFIFGLTAKGKLTAAAILLVTAASLPELFILGAAVFMGRPEISLANLLGANVADLSLVIGGAALLVGSIPIIGDYWRWELAATFLAGVAPILLMMDGNLSRIDGLILLTIYLIYLEGLVIDGKRKTLAKMGVERPGILTRIQHIYKHEDRFPMIELFAGLAMLTFGAFGLVSLFDQSGVFQLSPVVFGIVVISVVTTMQEYFEVINGAIKKSSALILTNLLGSVVTNATLLIGLLALIKPVSIGSVANYSIVNLTFVITFGLFWLFTSTKRKIERWEGLILVGLFVAFIGLVLMWPSI